MGRPVASLRNKRLAAMFASLVSVQTNKASDIVARCGPCSLYEMFKQCCPMLCRDKRSGPRDGISQAEFNKVLQVHLNLIGYDMMDLYFVILCKYTFRTF